jgi:hypothetical protein
MEYKTNSSDFFSNLFSWYVKQVNDKYYFDIRDYPHLNAKLGLKLIKTIPRNGIELTDQLIFEIIDKQKFFLARLEHGI